MNIISIIVEEDHAAMARAELVTQPPVTNALTTEQLASVNTCRIPISQKYIHPASNTS